MTLADKARQLITLISAYDTAGLPANPKWYRQLDAIEQEIKSQPEPDAWSQWKKTGKDAMHYLIRSWDEIGEVDSVPAALIAARDDVLGTMRNAHAALIRFLDAANKGPGYATRSDQARQAAYKAWETKRRIKAAKTAGKPPVISWEEFPKLAGK